MPKQELNNPQDLIQTLQSLARRTYLLISLIFFAAFLGVTIYGIIPKINNITLAYDAIKVEGDKLKILQDKYAQVNMIIDDPDFAQASIVDDILYSTNTFMPMMYTLSEVAVKNNVTNIVRLELSPGLVATPSAQTRTSQQSAASRLAAKKDSEGFTIFMELRGTYHQLVNFLHDLESYAPFNSVAYSEISNSLNGTATAQIEIMAQYYPPTLKAKPEDKLPSLTDTDKETLAAITRYTIPDLEALRQNGFTNYGRDNPFLNVVVPTELAQDIAQDAAALEQQ
jgi:hypothetical protein